MQQIQARRLLLVEPDPGVRGALARVLTDEGYEVVLCADVDSVDGKMGAERPLAAILDLNVPMTAAEARHGIGRLRAALVPVIVITALSGQGNAVMAAGACLLMEKPLSLPLLLQTVERLASLPRNEAEPGAAPLNEDFRCEP